ncbi:MAG: tRNA (adenosine(37)-N6)-dimethylallyltransferase MiaA [Planctomycetes bacterium]|nr:tRNA (adenosine(37)-N6)-dimethylallyltransferase MiaA [Planctomycetota bacterium]
MNILEKSYIITGPTASGKTSLAIKLAQHLNTEIICMDSMTLFKGMDIGTAKPTQHEQSIIKHHMLDILLPTEQSSVQLWLQGARKIAEELIGKGKSPIFVGGTPLYLKALIMGLFEIPEIPKHIRKELEEKFPQTNFADAYRLLSEIDPDSAKKIHPNDRRRIIRALEVWTGLGKTISSLQKQWEIKTDSFTNPDKIRCVWLQTIRQNLHQRIHIRTKQLLQKGWVDEVLSLRKKYPTLSKEASQAIGYSQISQFLDGLISFEKMEETINLATRQLAKKQETWLRHISGCTPLPFENNFHFWGFDIDIQSNILV